MRIKTGVTFKAYHLHRSARFHSSCLGPGRAGPRDSGLAIGGRPGAHWHVIANHLQPNLAQRQRDCKRNRDETHDERIAFGKAGLVARDDDAD